MRKRKTETQSKLSKDKPGSRLVKETPDSSTLQLRSRKKTDQNGNIAEKYILPKSGSTGNKEVDKYYAQQRELLDLYEVDRIKVNSENIEIDEDEKAPDRTLAQATLILNIASLIGNLVASIESGSLSVISTFIDSSMDISCSLVMSYCLRLINQKDEIEYPRGRERLELLGVIFCSCLMGVANMGMVMQSISSIANDKVDPVMTPLTLAILVVQTLLKAVLMALCYRRGSTSSIVVAMDLRNDLVTRALALVCGYVGDRYWKMADPLGAITVCVLIAISWFQHAAEHIPQLVGRRADQQNQSRILKLALDHDPRIDFIDHVMIYHTGQKALIELHIVMNENLPLKVTHGIAHPLEKKLQKLDFVERAFVHCDHVCDGD